MRSICFTIARKGDFGCIMVQGFERNGGRKCMKDADVALLAAEIRRSRGTLTALGDEVRQHLMLVMMESGRCEGLRVGEIAARTNLSRPAVSHHLRILKDAGIVGMRREGTRNYYFFDAAGSLDALIQTLVHAREIMLSLPDRSEEE